MRIPERNSPEDTKVNEEGGGVASDAGAMIPLQPVGKVMVMQAVLLQPMEVHRYPAAAPGGPHVGAGRCALRAAAAHGEPAMEQGP